MTVNALLEDRNGNLWVGGVSPGKSIFTILTPGRPSTRPENTLSVEPVSLTEDSDGVVWAVASDGVHSCQTAGAQYRCELSPVTRLRVDSRRAAITSVLHDRGGNLWIGTMGQGLLRYTAGALEHLTESDGLSGDLVEALFEDREGNVWVGTNNGIDRFREPKVARWSSLQGVSASMVTAIQSAHDGDIWFATIGGSVNRVHDGKITHAAGVFGRHGDVFALFEDRRQVLWAGTTHGLARLEGRTLIDIPAEDGRRYGRIFQIAEDRSSGIIWLADQVEGLASVRNGRITPARIDGIRPDSIHQLAIDRAGDVWIGLTQGGIAIVHDGSIRRVTAKNGLAAGRVQAIFEDTAGSMWVGTTEGMARFRAGSWMTWSATDGIPAGGVQAFAEDRASTLWLVTRSGVSPLALSDFDRRNGKPQHLALTFYGPNDGVRLPEFAGMANPRITLARDGRLWLATQDGVAALDPKSISRPATPPHVMIDELINAGTSLSPGGADLPVRGQSVEMEYAALRLATPEALRFRYRLDPVDRDWVDAGTRREVTYGHLAPGHYRFRVTARDEDGSWNPEPAWAAFTVQPRFYQTWMFWGACVCLAALLVYVAHKWRMRRLRTRFELVLQERTRLTRELHDTLLQGFAGVVYQLEAASRLIDTQPAAGRARLERALEQADQSLREARQALSCLRLPDLENRTLPEALERAAEKLVADSPVRFQMEVTGRSRELPYDVQANLFVIAREALNNAVAHGRPDRITLNVNYGGDEVALAVTDDGRGFDTGQPNLPDHWGLTGMRERARHIGANLTIRSAPGHGTAVEVVVGRPSRKRVAY
jgi:signal transduction histidine kinase/ligand-binding sensor domain-containing protein